MKLKNLFALAFLLTICGCSGKDNVVQDEGINSAQAKATGASKGNIPANLMFTNKHQRDVAGVGSGSKKGD